MYSCDARGHDDTSAPGMGLLQVRQRHKQGEYTGGGDVCEMASDVRKIAMMSYEKHGPSDPDPDKAASNYAPRHKCAA